MNHNASFGYVKSKMATQIFSAWCSAEIILAAAEGVQSQKIAYRVGVSPPCSCGRRAFLRCGSLFSEEPLAGLEIDPSKSARKGTTLLYEGPLNRFRKDPALR